MLKKQFLLVSILLLFCFAAVSSAFANGENSLQVNLSFEKNSFAFNETVPVQVTISNIGEREIKILRWQTPIDGVQGDLFSLTVDGKAVNYIGALIKRAAPTENDYLTLKPGETVVSTVDLADYYDLSQSGYYQIAYRTEPLTVSAKELMLRRQVEALKSESVSVWIYGRAQKMTPSFSMNEFAYEDFTAVGCDSTQTAALPAAVSSANYYATNSFNYLNNGALTSRYTTWFGAYTSTRYSTVLTHFLNIKNLLAADTFRIACNNSSCQPSYFAFVYPNDATHTVYVCNQFWLAATTGTDSKAGTLIHEMSHFSDIAGTNDYVYGQSGAANLANTNPNNAINNADNHEYFAEASPTNPTAASVNITGRVVNSAGRAVSYALVTITGAGGQTRTVRTNAFGYYRFTDVTAGSSYVLSARHKSYRFTEQTITANSDLSVNFTASLN